MSEATNRPRIAVVGGGLTGIATALRLSHSGEYSVTLFEKAERLGGLSASYTWESSSGQKITWDKFYHVILSTDGPLRQLLDELGVADKLFWRETRVGFFGDGRLVSFSSSWDFLRFPFLSLWQKLRLALGILRCARITDPQALDKVVVRQWLTTVFGRRVYESFWAPLLRSKLGAASERTSAAFIWATIRRLYGARQQSGGHRERMGHVSGGYHTILQAAEKKLRAQGVKLRLAEGANSLKSAEASDRSANCWIINDDKELSFDRVILTTPCAEILRLIPNEEHAYWKRLAEVEYLSLVCVLLILDRSLSPYYVTNLLDQTLPFTGIIEATNIVAPEDVGGAHLVYLPKYMPQEDPVTNWTDEEIRQRFIESLKRVFPDLQDSQIRHCAVFREKYVQPLQDLNFLKNMTGFKSPLAGLYVVNTSMIENSTLNNNAAVTLGRNCADEVTADLQNS